MWSKLCCFEHLFTQILTRWPTLFLCSSAIVCRTERTPVLEMDWLAGGWHTQHGLGATRVEEILPPCQHLAATPPLGSDSRPTADGDWSMSINLNDPARHVRGYFHLKLLPCAPTSLKANVSNAGETTGGTKRSMMILVCREFLIYWKW